MDSDRQVSSIILPGTSDYTFLLLHGYTGGPEDFGDLPAILNKTFDARVHVPVLHGHGTRVEDLLDYSYADFVSQVENLVADEITAGRRVILGGFSLGALMALDVATRQSVAGVFAICSPVYLRFPLNIPMLSHVRHIKPYWRKRISTEERERIGPIFFYEHMPTWGLAVCQDASRSVQKRLSQLRTPTLAIFSGQDSVCSPKSVSILSGHTHIRTLVSHNGHHRPVSETFRTLIAKQVPAFVKEEILAHQPEEKKGRVAAIIPAFNEGVRIGSVLEQLERTPALDEIIVVDDGSTDDTAAVAASFKRVRVIRNALNKGKAYSMEQGVQATDCDIIFFCDADLRGLTPTIVERIINPVKSGRFDMFIGLRQNKMQRAVRLFAINSGERALRRELWEKLPNFFKIRYRVEAGLNYYAHVHGRGFGYDVFPYFQTLKEKKYGLLTGTILRWRMNIDVLMAYLELYLLRGGK